VPNHSSEQNQPTNPPTTPTQPNTSPYNLVLTKLTKWTNTHPSKYLINLLTIKIKITNTLLIPSSPKIMIKVTNTTSTLMKLLKIKHCNTLQLIITKSNRNKFKKMSLKANSETKYKIGIKMMI
jgi:hypothetical protein